MQRYELIVIGAGPAGLSAAIQAAEKGMRVVVFDEKMWSEIHFEGGEGSTTTNFFELYHSYFPK